MLLTLKCLHREDWLTGFIKRSTLVQEHIKVEAFFHWLSFYWKHTSTLLHCWCALAQLFCLLRAFLSPSSLDVINHPVRNNVVASCSVQWYVKKRLTFPERSRCWIIDWIPLPPCFIHAINSYEFSPSPRSSAFFMNVVLQGTATCFCSIVM